MAPRYSVMARKRREAVIRQRGPRRPDDAPSESSDDDLDVDAPSESADLAPSRRDFQQSNAAKIIGNGLRLRAELSSSRPQVDDSPRATPRARHAGKRAQSEQLVMQLVTHLDRDHIYEMRERFAAHDMMVGEMDFVRIVKDVLPDYIVRPKDQPRGEKSASEMAGLSVLDDEEDLVANLIELYKEIDVNGDGDVRAPARESKTGGAFGRTRRMPSGRGDAAATTGVFHGEGSRRHRGSEPNRPRRSDARGQTRRWDARARPSTPPRFRAGSSAAVGRARAEASLGRVSPALDSAAVPTRIFRGDGGVAATTWIFRGDGGVAATRIFRGDGGVAATTWIFRGDGGVAATWIFRGENPAVERTSSGTIAGRVGGVHPVHRGEGARV